MTFILEAAAMSSALLVLAIIVPVCGALAALLVVLFDPTRVLPLVDCAPPKPDAHTLQWG